MIDLHFIKDEITKSTHPSLKTPVENGKIIVYFYVISVQSCLDSLQIFKDDLFATNTTLNEKQPEIQLESSSKNNKISERTVLYLDLFTSKEISPYFIVSYREYILVVNISKHLFVF
jgi:hypothetical protein